MSEVHIKIAVNYLTRNAYLRVTITAYTSTPFDYRCETGVSQTNPQLCLHLTEGQSQSCENFHARQKIDDIMFPEHEYEP